MKNNYLKQFLLMSFLIMTSAIINTTYAQLPKSYSFKPKSEPIYVVDGIVTNKAYLDKLKPDQIEYLEVLKGEKATEKYGDKAVNGVVEITTKKDNSANDDIGISTAGSPIYVIDGIEKTSFDIDKLDSDDVESMNILKGEKAISKYGDKGRNGVIVITTNKHTKTNIKIDSKKTDIVAPIYIVDGVEKTSFDIDKLNPDDIESMNILKEEKAIEKYGNKGKLGVIEIHLKK